MGETGDNMLSTESKNTLEKHEHVLEINGLLEHVTNLVAILRMDNSSAEAFKYEKKPSQIKKELQQFAKDLHNLSAETKAHLYINGFDFQSFAKAVSTPYVRKQTNQDREIITGQMELIYDKFPYLTQCDLKEICLIILKESNYKAKNLETAAYNMVKHITPAY